MISLNEITVGLKEPTGSDVIHLRTLRKVIGLVAVGLAPVLAIGENIRDALLPHASRPGREILEGSISAYFHTGMREAFVGSLCAIAVFLMCYKGYEKRDNIAANIAGFCAFLVAFFPTRERSQEAADTGVPLVDSATLFSTANAPDPAYVGYVHFISAAILFATLAVMSLFLFTLSTKPVKTEEKKTRNKVYVACGVTILVCVVFIIIGKFSLGQEFSEQTKFVFWLETIAVTAFGISWLTKAEVFFPDSEVTQ